MGKFSSYKLPLKSLPEGIHEFDFRLGKQFFADMESSDIRDAALDVHVTVTHKSDMYELQMDVKGNITLICDRCLDELEWPVDTAYHIFVKYGPDFCDDNDELLEIPESDATLNIAYMLYDTVALTIPIKHVHPLGKCNRAMTTLLKKHRANIQPTGMDEDDEIIDEMIDQVESDEIQNDASTDDGEENNPTDPRWDALKGLADND